MQRYDTLMTVQRLCLILKHICWCFYCQSVMIRLFHASTEFMRTDIWSRDKGYYFHMRGCRFEIQINFFYLYLNLNYLNPIFISKNTKFLPPSQLNLRNEKLIWENSVIIFFSFFLFFLFLWWKWKAIFEDIWKWATLLEGLKLIWVSPKEPLISYHII